MIDCNNVNLKEVVEKAEKYDQLKIKYDKNDTYWGEEIERIKKEYSNRDNLILKDLIGLGFEFTDKYDGIWKIPHAVKHILSLDSFRQNLADRQVALGKLEKQLRSRYEDDVREFEVTKQMEMELREEKLTKAWKEFNAIKSNEYAKALDEIINNKKEK